MWTAENRPLYDRDKLRYPSDLTDAEWQHIGPLLPPAKRGGGKRTVDMREVVNGLMYVLSTGCQWRYIPKDLPPRSTVMTTSPGGATTARWRKSITRSTSNAASRTNPRPVLLPALSIARA
jgi:transposase